MLKRILLVAGVCLSTAVPASHAEVAPGITASAEATTATVRVASFNLRNAALKQAKGLGSWSQRRDEAIATILDEGIDVVGVQETSFAPHSKVDYARGRTQYLDLLNGLHDAGGHYALTTKAAYNCAKLWTPYKCAPRRLGAGAGERILYNTDTLEKVSRGSRRFRAQGGGERYLVYAALRIKETGREFFFATTHFVANNESVKEAQWRETIKIIKAKRAGLPVVFGGDLNARRGSKMSRSLLPAMDTAGFGDVLNQKYDENPVSRPRAASTINGWVNSFNGGRENVSEFGYYKRRDKTGNNVDWIFASDAFRVREWEVVVRYDPQSLDVLGEYASDHNMVKATLEIS